MSSNQAHELQRLPTPSRPTAASLSRAQSTLNRNTVVTYTGLYTSQSPQFHPGLLSRGPPEPTPSFLHKLNSVYTAMGLALTLVLTFITYRLSVLSWQLSQWTAQKDFHELCLELKQATLPLSKDCNIALAEGLSLPPTFISKRWLDGLKSTIVALKSPDKTQYYNIRNASAASPVSEQELASSPFLASSDQVVTYYECNASCGSWLENEPMLLASDFSPNRIELPSSFVIGVINILSFTILYRKWIKYGSSNRTDRLTKIGEVNPSALEANSLPLRYTYDKDLIAFLGILVGYNNTSNQLRKRKAKRA